MIAGLALPRWAQAYEEDDRRSMAECVLTIRKQPFAEVIAAMLAHAMRPGAEVVFSGQPELPQILRNRHLRAQLR
ncbi:hypothetical protein [Catellatospora chokoriensis]|uniref:Uncharacterized protein n=1 Tax=Catellatospora chokoriensis TaxID=310353 RepID=A0A8J3K2R8_9ACTN|nr:hypothetical protein [Catellatospora chokoriensis]GIF88414.1 hypothetical protein Cch02nite_18580 [Catellatospora chokoriensis]